MKFVTFLNSENNERLGLFINQNIIDLSNSAKELNKELPSDIIAFIKGGKDFLSIAQEIQNAFLDSKISNSENVFKIISPVPHPPSCRDGYAFRQHVSTARRNRGLEMIPEFDQFPIFYFTNHNSIIGEGDVIVEDDHLQNMDFELEAAVVISKKGRNIPAEKADDFIFGYTIMNDLSARVLQMDEMKLNLGPAKGKDFATSLGPWLVTPDELAQFKISTTEGDKYSLKMTAYHNGKLISEGNMKDMNWTFAQIIERASYGVDLYPGDVIGSGTVGTGCYLELNGTHALEAKAKGETFSPVWLKDGDSIELEITGLGKLSNKIVKNTESYSILNKKKL